jgi:antitoxin component of RelBE/YafQ-DinJ toxin-antitoxin module
MRTLHSFLPEPRPERTVVIQARVSPDLKARVEEVAYSRGWNPSEVIRAGVMKFLDEENLPTQKPFKTNLF